jgi:hypothetical protein
MACCNFATYPTMEWHQMLCKSRKKCNGTLAMTRQTFGEESMSRTRKSPNSPRPKNARQVKEPRACTSFRLTSRGLFEIEFLLAGKAVNSAYYCDVSRRLHENVRRLHPELLRQRNWLLYYDNASSHTFFLTKKFLTKSSMIVVSHPTVFFSVSPTEDETGRLPF